MSTISPQTATLANVTSSNTSVSLWADVASANGRIVFNDSSAILYLKFGATASTTSYTVQVAAGASYEFSKPVYSGAVDGIWASQNGAARLTSW